MDDWSFLPSHEQEALLKAKAHRNPSAAGGPGATFVATVRLGGQETVVRPRPAPVFRFLALPPLILSAVAGLWDRRVEMKVGLRGSKAGPGAAGSGAAKSKGRGSMCASLDPEGWRKLTECCGHPACTVVAHFLHYITIS